MNQISSRRTPHAGEAGKKPSRHLALDTLRGGLLVIMALNHIPSFLERFTQQPFGFMTAAEGFVFLAGLVVGLVYTHRWQIYGPQKTTLLLFRRGLVIYRAHIATIAAIYLWMFLYSKWTGQLPVGTPWLWFQQPAKSLAATLALLHQPGLLDVLPTYCGLLLITPLVMWQLFKKRIGATLAVSGIMWLLTNLIDPPHPTIIGVINTGAFNFGAWQFLYVVGVVLGYLWANDKLPKLRLKHAWLWFVVGVILFLSACSHRWIDLGISKDTWWLLTNKNNLAPIRLLNVGLILLLTHAWLATFRNELNWSPLGFLGRHSLAVFSVHCVAALIMIGLPDHFDTAQGRVLGPIAMLLVMFATAALAEQRTLAIRRKRLAP